MLDLSRAARAVELGGPGAATELRRLRARASNRSPRDADWAVGAGGSVRVVPARPGHHARRRRSPRRRSSRRPTRPANRVAPLVYAEQQPKRTTAQATALGITGTVGAYETFFGGESEPDPQRSARVASGRPQADRSGRDVLVQRDDRRALRREGLPRGAGDHQRRARDRARRRRVPGLDDRVQRRVRGRAADHRTHEPRALHLALSARSRRNRQLSGRRPEVRQRHRPLAAAPHLGQLVLAHGGALRDAAAPARRVRDAAAARRRAAAGQEDEGSEASRSGRRSSTTPASPRRRRASSGRSTRPPGSCSRTSRGRRTTARCRSWFAVGQEAKKQPPAATLSPAGTAPTAPH